MNLEGGFFFFVLLMDNKITEYVWLKMVKLMNKHPASKNQFQWFFLSRSV